MIPIEILWLTLMGVFGIIGMARGLWKEVGTSTILLLSIFTLFTLWKIIGDKVETALSGRLPPTAPQQTAEALYYIATIIFVAFVSYQGVVLEFPVRKHAGPLKWVFGFLGGLVNGYLIIGTIWNAANTAAYFGLDDIQSSLTPLYQKLLGYMPLSIMGSNDFIPYAFLAVGMILLLAIVLK
jgi:uncharacterized membrane protein required for colicin V production